MLPWRPLGLGGLAIVNIGLLRYFLCSGVHIDRVGYVCHTQKVFLYYFVSIIKMYRILSP